MNPKIMPLSAELALAQLQKTFPKASEYSSYLGAHEQFRIDLKLGDISLICMLNDFGWSLRLMNRDIVQANSAHDPTEVDILVCQQDTLASAIAALKSAAEEQRRVLGMVL